ncbi:hydrogenase maturation protease [Peribacillus acanthi]|uniref:hydrogenase maturation protease n=1 Tax=Peribacillus acanthi TaxID=2171554 RepID=UPI000D3E7F3F|nr:hydrogenase maturation protease [Peribacillus acanthi]
MEKIIVLGIGNQLMMDDGVGIYIVEELAKHDHTTNIEYLIGESDIDYCLDQIEGATFVIILDAVCAGKQPGEITIYPISELHQHQPLNLSPHNMHLFQVLYQLKERVKGYLIGVEPYKIEFHIGLSQPMNEIWNGVILLVKREIGFIINENNGLGTQ